MPTAVTRSLNGGPHPSNIYFDREAFQRDIAVNEFRKALPQTRTQTEIQEPPADAYTIVGGPTELNVDLDALRASAGHADRAAEAFTDAHKALEQSSYAAMTDFQIITEQAREYRDRMLAVNCVVVPYEPDESQRARMSRLVEELHGFLGILSQISGEFAQASTIAFQAAHEYESQNNAARKALEIVEFFSPLYRVIRGWNEDKEKGLMARIVNVALPLDERHHKMLALGLGTVGEVFTETLFPFGQRLTPQHLKVTKLDPLDTSNLSNAFVQMNEQNNVDKGAIQIHSWEEDGETRYFVYTPGTASWFLWDERHPLDMSSNLKAVYGRDSTGFALLLAAMEAAGIPEGADVTFAGYSQGGMLARKAAQDAFESGKYNVKGVATIASPTGHIELDSSIPSVSIQNEYDMVPVVDGKATEGSTNHMTISAPVGRFNLAEAHMPAASAAVLSGARKHNAMVDTHVKRIEQGLPPAGAKVTSRSYQLDTSAPVKGEK